MDYCSFKSEFWPDQQETNVSNVNNFHPSKHEQANQLPLRRKMLNSQPELSF